MAKVREVYQSFTDSTTKTLIQDEAYRNIRPIMEKHKLANPYAQTVEAANDLEGFGIATNPYSIELHTHAAAKTIENKLLEVLGSILPQEPVTFMFLKPRKLNYMRRNPRIKDIFHNVAIEPRDVARYPKETIIDKLTEITTDTAYISDTLHFLDPSYIVETFQNCPKLQTLYATLVLPVEAAFKMESTHPNIYSLKYFGDGFQYIPGNHGGGAYHHEFSHLQWLKVGKIKWRDPKDSFLGHLNYTTEQVEMHTVTVQLQESFAANHLYCIRRGDLLTPEVRTFGQPDRYVIPPQIFLPKVHNCKKPILKKTMMQLFLYVRTVKVAKNCDIFAKVRQLIKSSDLDKYSAVELVYLVSYMEFLADLQATTCFSDTLSGGLLTKTLAPVRAWIQEKKMQLFGLEDYAKLVKAVDFHPVDFSFKVETWDFRFHPLQAWKAFRPREVSDVEEMESLFSDGDLLDCFTRMPAYAVNAEEDLAAIRKTPEMDVGQEVKEPAGDRNQYSNPAETFLNKLHRKHSREVKHQAVKKAKRLAEIQESMRAEGEAESSEMSGGMGAIPSNAELPSTSGARQELTLPTTKPVPARWEDASFTDSSVEEEQVKLPGKEAVETATQQVIEGLPWKHWIPQLNAVGFKALEIQRDRSGTMIMPITEMVSGLEKEDFPEGTPKELARELLAMNRSPATIPLDLLRARDYGSDVKNKRIGAITKTQATSWGEYLTGKIESLTERKVAACVIHGAGGSGKSHAIQKALREIGKGSDITVVLPTNELRLDWSKKVPNTEPYMFKTYEKALIGGTGSIVIFDDYSKLPPGYIEALICFYSKIKLVILTGDSRQSVYHETAEDASIRHLGPATEYFSKYCRYYLNATHRNKKDLANMLGVYSERTGVTEISMSAEFLEGIPTLVPSDEKRRLYMGTGRNDTFTYAGCQGLTKPKVQIVLDHNTQVCSANVMYTALSRATDRIHFVNTSANSSAFWEKLDSTPYLKTFLSVVREQALREYEPAEAEPIREPEPQTHMCVENEESVLEEYKEELLEKFDREIHSESHGHSNCVQTEDTTIQLFSHQQAKDETLLWATIDARLKTSNQETNFREFLSKKDIGDVLFLNYQKAMGLPKERIPFSQEVWEACAHEVQSKYLSKSKCNLINGTVRQSPDFDENKIMVFLKSQWVTKVEKLGLPKIKPGQTIAAFYQQTVMLFGTMARYMRWFRQAFQPKEVFINCETTPEDMSAWALNNWNFSRPSLANDYTAFDQSQDGAMLQFEVLKAKHHCIPEEIIQAYIDIKTNAQIFLGTLSIMRLTGEGPTFDANTECNIAYTHTKFDIPAGTAQVYAGDDSALDCVPEVKHSFHRLEDKLLLKSKPVITQQKKGSWPEFCGWLITPKGVMKDPIKLHVSLKLAEAKGELKKCQDSYEIDLSYAYDHKDSLHDLFDEKQCQAHTLTCRTLIKSGRGTVSLPRLRNFL
uniref:RNA replication protein n=1 Tax=Potato virus X TaxID=12183 RepID=A0A8B0FEW8_PVX|nr:RNA-dependent RNA polymerase [Potato virus X]